MQVGLARSSTVTSRNTPTHIRRKQSARVTTTNDRKRSSRNISTGSLRGSSPLSSAGRRIFRLGSEKASLPRKRDRMPASSLSGGSRPLAHPPGHRPTHFTRGKFASGRPVTLASRGRRRAYISFVRAPVHVCRWGRNQSGKLVQTRHSTRAYSVVIRQTRAKPRREVTAMDASNENRWLSRQELADRYGVPVKTPAEWASKGTGPRYAKFGKHVRYRLSDVIDWESRHFPKQSAPSPE
jgi:hypothetical protein